MQDGDVVTADGKMGIDGSGSHDEEKKREKSYIGIFWCPLSIHMNNELIWSNILLNSTMFSRPLCLLRKEENRESVKENFTPYLEAAHAMETAAERNINGVKFNLSVHTEVSMIDGKMVDLI